MRTYDIKRIIFFKIYVLFKILNTVYCVDDINVRPNNFTVQTNINEEKSKSKIDKKMLNDKEITKSHNLVSVLENDTFDKNNKDYSVVLVNQSNSTKGEAIVKMKMLTKLKNSMKAVAKQYFRTVRTENDQQKVIEKIKKKLNYFIKRNSDYYGKNNSQYVDIILQGIETQVQKQNTKTLRKEKNQFNSNRRTVLNKLVTINNINETEKTHNCELIRRTTCLNISSLSQFSCKYNKSHTIPINKLCDDSVDCPDGSDEKSCKYRGSDEIYKTMEVLTAIEENLLQNCFENRSDGLIMSKNGSFYEKSYLQGVLIKQFNFIERYLYELRIGASLNKSNSSFKHDNRAMKGNANELAFVLGTVKTKLDEVLCSNLSNNVDVFERFPDSLEEERHENTLPPKSCLCEEQNHSTSTYSSICSRVCYQRYSLGRFTCHAVNGEFGVNLDLICDGKYDCHGGKDEIGCIEGKSLSKFEARSNFNDIIKKLARKFLIPGQNSLNTQILHLHETIAKLQILTTDNERNISDIKRVRNISFETIKALYNELLNEGSDMNELDKAFMFLMTINEDLVAALKQSHTGNKILVSPNQCYCIGVHCGVRKCSRKCSRACSVEPYLFKYPCGNSFSSNFSVPVELICNGENNCNNGEDEINCRKEFCQKRHLAALYKYLQTVGHHLSGTLLGEAFSSWKKKALTAVTFVDQLSERPSPTVLRRLATNILRKLVNTFADLSNFRRYDSKHADVAFKEFFQVAQKITNLLKSCNQ